jgi:hypothetical protein
MRVQLTHERIREFRTARAVLDEQLNLKARALRRRFVVVRWLVLIARLVIA